MAKVRELRSIIYGKYDSEAEFAQVIGWERQRLSKITNGQKEPNVEELNSLALGLGISVEKVAQIFLNFKSPNRQQSARIPMA